MSAPLEIPAASAKAFAEALAKGHEPWAFFGVHIPAIAAPVVAAELRRLAGEWSHTGVMYSVLRDLRARADEIEGAS